MDITPPDDRQPAGTNRVMDINESGSQQPLAFSDESASMQDPEQPQSQEGGGIKCHNIPTCAAYNSLLSAEKRLTEVSALPLIAAPAHEWQTLVIVLKHTEQINSVVVGPNRKQSSPWTWPCMNERNSLR